MPESDGIETIHELKKDFPRLKVIAMSGGGRSPSTLDSVRTTMSVLGIDAFLRKPFDFGTLLQSVRQVLAA